MADDKDFKKSIDLIIHRHEGVTFTCDPVDADGGGTKFGLTLKFLADHPDYGDIDGDGDVDIADLMKMPEAWGEKIYKRFFWDWWPMAIIPAPLAHLCNDIGINSGQRAAAKLLQECLGCGADGVIGPHTRRFITAIGNLPQLCERLLARRMDNYNEIVRTNPAKSKYWRGWKNRVQMLREEYLLFA